MRLPRIIGLLALGLAFLYSGCRTTGNPDASGLAASQGQPEIYTGIMSGSFDRMDFYEIDPVTGSPKRDAANKPIIRLTQPTNLVGGFGGMLEIADGKFGPMLNPSDTTTYSWLTNTPWKCGKAEEFVKGVPSTSPDKDEDCFLELTTTGDSGFAATIIGLGPSGSGGLGNWVNSTKPAVKPGVLHPVANGPLKPGEINTIIDAPVVLAGMRSLQSKFPLDKQKTKERNTCLKNALAVGWQDIQAHYYCIIDLSYRDCYARKLLESRGSGQANPFGYAYDACFKGQNVLPKGEDHIFQYVMYTRIGALDFNIEAANDVINEFYGVSQPDPSQAGFDGAKRPRRITDTYPWWLADQPRYNKVRQAQLDAQKRLAGGQ